MAQPATPPATLPPLSGVAPSSSPSPAARAAFVPRRVLLERLARPLLARFLSTHAADFCAAHGISLDALAASSPFDRAPVHRLYDLLREGALPAMPEAALGLLANLESLATTRGGEVLIALDAGRVLPRAKLGDEDLALTAILDHPELAADAAAQMPTEAGDAVDGFTEYDPAGPATIRFGAQERAAVERLFGAELEKRDRTRYCSVLVTRERGRILLEVEYCRRAKTRDKLDAEALAVAPSTDIHSERAHAEIDLETGRLALHAPHPALKEVLRKVLGTVVAGSSEHFSAARVYDMAPFRDLALALTPHGDRLLAVALRRITLRTPGASEIDLARPHGDLRHDAHVPTVLEGAMAAGVPVAVKLYLTILGHKRPLKVELSAKQGRNRLQFKRSDPEIVAVVRAYLAARGVLRELAPTNAEAAASA